MMKHKKMLLLGLGHLMIDLEGIYLINVQYNNMDFKHIALFFLAYNLIAFGLQPFLGYFADVHNKYFHFVIIGSLLPLLALLLKDFGLLAIVLATIGNAMYHVGGGVLSMNMYPEKAAPAGIFVAPGALGVFVGYRLALLATPYTMYIILVALVIVGLILVDYKGYRIENRYQKVSANFIKIVLLILVIISIRGFMGSLLMFTWKGELTYDILLIACIFLGKFLGGILGDRYGYKEVGIFGLVSSAPFLLFGYYYVAAGIIGALLFNLTMAITLFLIIDNLGRYKGFAFGLTTLTLVIAFIPSSLGLTLPSGLVYYVVITLLVVIGAYTLDVVSKLYELNKQERGY